MFQILELIIICLGKVNMVKIIKFMFITLSIYSKNLNSLTNFFKFFYKLKMNKNFRLKFHLIQSQQQQKFIFFSTLRSPHVNKKSQEQFEYYVYTKKIKIHISQINKFLLIWKQIKLAWFADIELKIRFLVYNESLKLTLFDKVNYDKFKTKYLNKLFYTYTTTYSSLKLLDLNGEILLKNFINETVIDKFSCNPYDSDDYEDFEYTLHSHSKNPYDLKPYK